MNRVFSFLCVQVWMPTTSTRRWLRRSCKTAIMSIPRTASITCRRSIWFDRPWTIPSPTANSGLPTAKWIGHRKLFRRFSSLVFSRPKGQLRNTLSISSEPSWRWTNTCHLQLNGFSIYLMKELASTTSPILRSFMRGNQTGMNISILTSNDDMMARSKPIICFVTVCPSDSGSISSRIQTLCSIFTRRPL